MALSDHGSIEKPMGMIAARVVDEQGGWLAVVGPAVAPAHQGDERRHQLRALLRQHVLASFGPLLVGAGLDDPLSDQRLEPVGQHVRGDAQILLDLPEATQAVGDVTDDQGRPPFAGDVQGAGDRAGMAFEAGAFDVRIVSLA